MRKREEKDAIYQLLGNSAITHGEEVEDLVWADELNRASPEVDCIVTFPSGRRLAIEHTEAQGLPSHLQVESRLRSLESQLSLARATNRQARVIVPVERIRTRPALAVVVVALNEDSDAAHRMLDQTLRVAVSHKNDRLGEYKRKGTRAILLIQVLDISSTSPVLLHSGIARRPDP